MCNKNEQNKRNKKLFQLVKLVNILLLDPIGQSIEYENIYMCIVNKLCFVKPALRKVNRESTFCFGFTFSFISSLIYF